MVRPGKSRKDQPKSKERTRSKEKPRASENAKPHVSQTFAKSAEKIAAQIAQRKDLIANNLRKMQLLARIALSKHCGQRFQPKS
jgi:hypothetical protein